MPQPRTRSASVAAATRQHGIALITALILLILVTLIGLVAIRGTATQQKMTANFYDRSLAFQAAEAGLVAGAAALASSPGTIRNCGQGGGICRANPFEDEGFDASFIQTLGSAEFDGGGTAAAPPQYVIESMGTYIDPSSSTGFSQSANSAQYNAPGSSMTAIYYRITARSGDPAAIGERAVVTLQAMYKQ